MYFVSIIAGIPELVVCSRDRPEYGHIRRAGLKHVSAHVQKPRRLFVGIRKVLLPVGYFEHNTENRKPKTETIGRRIACVANCLGNRSISSCMELYHVRFYTVA
jgi:hypothetical protein